MLGLAVVDAVDWTRLFHAYAAAADTPGHLHGLLSGDEAVQSGALEHLYAAVLHQGTIYPATAPAVRVVAGVLGADQLRAATESEPLLVHVLRWLAHAFESARDVEPRRRSPATAQEADAFWRRLYADDPDAWRPEVSGPLAADGEQALLDAAVEVAVAVLSFVQDEDARVRQAAVGVSANVAQLGVAHELLPRLQPVLGARLAEAGGRYERCELVLALGRTGADVTGWLSDDDPAVRACAAVASHGSRAGTDVLLAALEDPAAADEWFDEPPTSFQRHVRFVLLEHLLDRGLTLAELLPTARRMIELAGPYTVDSDVAPLLRAAFPDNATEKYVEMPLPATIDSAQQELLAALVANDGIWERTNGNAKWAFGRVGLPHDRQAVARMAGVRWPPRRLLPWRRQSRTA